MSDCTHENRTIDCICNDCGYDFIVDAQNDKIRQQERERIIKLLEADKRELSPWEPPLSSKVNHNRDINRLIALIKGKN